MPKPVFAPLSRPSSQKTPPPAAQPKINVCSSGERIQWVLIFGLFITFVVVAMFQKVQIDILTARINKSIEGNDYVIGAIEKRILNLVTTGSVNGTTSTEIGAGAPQNVGIPGVNATVVVPALWKQVGTGQTLSYQLSSGVLTIQRWNIGDVDLQDWYKQSFGLPANFVASRVAEANKSGLAVTGSDLKITGPNQVKIAGNLAMDMTISYLKSFESENATAQTKRLTAVRRGGDVIVFELNVPTSAVDSLLPEVDAALSTLTFGE